MTKEQAIERLKSKLDNDKEYLEQCNPFSDLVNEVRLDNKSIEIVLSMLEEKDKEIQFQEDINKTELNRHKKTEKSLKGQMIKQNKMIDLMTEYIEDELTVDEFCTKEGCYADNYIDGHCEKCLNCIKQYFEDKAKELLNK